MPDLGSVPATTAVVVAATPGPSPTQQPFDPSRVEPGVIGLAFFLVMAIAVALLWRSMRHHLGKIDVDRDRPADEADSEQGPPDKS